MSKISFPAFIPSKYALHNLNGISSYYSRKQGLGDVKKIEKVILEAKRKVEKEIGYSFLRPLAVCIYFDTKDSFRCLHRELSSSMLLVPYSGSDGSLIAIHSETANPVNGDRDRMLRHLSHEFVHLANWEVSGSVKKMGDKSIGMKIPPWLDEGLAEFISLRITGRLANFLESRMVTAIAKSCTPRQIDQFLNNFDSDGRTEAFAIVTSVVQVILAKTSWSELFKDAAKISELEKNWGRYIGGGRRGDSISISE